MASRTLTIKLFVDKAKNKVALAECNADFVDAMLSLLTMPMGNIIRLSHKDVQIGCMQNIYRSLADLERSCFVSDSSRNMLLHPVSSVARTIQSPAINLDDSDAEAFYICDSLELSSAHSKPRPISRFKNDKCECGSPMSVQVRLTREAVSTCDGVLFNGARASKFVVTDSLHVDLVSTALVLKSLDDVGVDYGELEVREVNVGNAQLLHLLRSCLVSDTPLTDVFLEDAHGKSASNDCHVNKTARTPESDQNPDLAKSPAVGIQLELLVDKNRNRVLYAQDKDGSFSELICTFMALPLGAVVDILGGNTGVTCVDNLYQTIRSHSCFIDGRVLEKSNLLKFSLHENNRRFNFEKVDASQQEFYLCRDTKCYPNALLGQGNCPTCNKRSVFLVREKYPFPTRGFFWNANLLVTEDLRIRVFSVMSYFEHLRTDATGAPAGRNLAEETVTVGENEVLAILKSCLTSKTPLSDVFLK